MNKHKILIIIDAQNDFIDGALRNEEALAAVPKIVKKIKDFDGDIIVTTKDSHGKNYLKTKEGSALPVKHCIQGTVGWCINDDISKALKDRDDLTVMNFNKPTFGSVDMSEYIKDEISKYGSGESFDIELCGFCTDICVISNALMLKAFNYETVDISVDASCCAGVTPEKHNAALDVMESCQIKVNNRKAMKTSKKKVVMTDSMELKKGPDISLKSSMYNNIYEYTDRFLDKHGFTIEDDSFEWINTVGGIALVNDYYISFNDMRTDIDRNIQENIFFEWYEYRLELAMLGAHDCTYEMYLDGRFPYTKEQLEDMRRHHREVETHRQLLEEIIRSETGPIAPEETMDITRLTKSKQLHIVAYFNTSGMPEEVVREYLEAVEDMFESGNDGTVSYYILPIKKGETRVECVNPPALKDESSEDMNRKIKDLDKAYKALMKKLKAEKRKTK